MNAVVRAELADEAWAPSSFNAVVLAFLKAEWNKYLYLAQQQDRRLVDQADLADPAQNRARLDLLFRVRGPLLQHVPRNTEWFEVRYLGPRHFWQLRNIHHIHWSGHSPTNDLEENARLRDLDPVRDGDPAMWQPILWAHERAGPFTILEGNHRLTAR